jgi:hypothetical protein
MEPIEENIQNYPTPSSWQDNKTKISLSKNLSIFFR